MKLNIYFLDYSIMLRDTEKQDTQQEMQLRERNKQNVTSE